ncbi:LEAF RUST 10 DISEASE-RESISTANCE LOCUS RECEPTOR-LIKE PROTEIN KINASE-like 1.2 isoform X2 [Humulus lupulus]|uniref:LEAF RUST 10 DISEASE-RESISTANCE LOCUS RECEPTOR-LIKE PROTEIN KINASE-like 1.2 isoform X2 n=1 Tax=Humulus lupulus TaxID=3486 RepID=UPI002B4147E5|nr:LEAF RUST 10 DISEASE-RESISTANCE LOCUS RECEPTOR-LIKE PROTEIN KINASE-like 1.2 isoform X2 [Humulus lupulus]
MNKKSFFHLWITTLFCNSLTESVASVTGGSKYEACRPTNCGSVPKISYPFIVEGAGADYCGLQSFRISCKQNRPFFSINKGFSFLIKDISYEHHSFRLLAIDNDAVDASCVEPKVTFDIDRNLTYSSSHAFVVIFYRCRTTSFLPDLEKIPFVSPCVDNSSISNSTATRNSLVALVQKDDMLGTIGEESNKHCEAQVAIPVELNDDVSSGQTIRTVNYAELLTNGFSLTWNGRDIDQCTECERSGGRCGFENGNSACYCPNGTTSSSCGTHSTDTGAANNSTDFADL